MQTLRKAAEKQARLAPPERKSDRVGGDFSLKTSQSKLTETDQ